MDLQGQVALVVGAGSGLGRGAALRWAARGGRVIAADIDREGVDETAARHPGILACVIDVRDAAAVQSLIGETENRLGPIVRVDQTAGVFPTGLAADMPAAAFAEVMEINYLGMVNVGLAVMPFFRARRAGVLVNYCSIAGLAPCLQMAAYSASKAACIAFTEVLFEENRRHGVHVVCLCPPSVETPLLQQAVSRPRILQATKKMTVDQVLDRLERAIAKRKFWCLPSLNARLTWSMRRISPALAWRMVRWLETG